MSAFRPRGGRVQTITGLPVDFFYTGAHRFPVNLVPGGELVEAAVPDRCRSFLLLGDSRPGERRYFPDDTVFVDTLLYRPDLGRFERYIHLCRSLKVESHITGESKLLDAQCASHDAIPHGIVSGPAAGFLDVLLYDVRGIWQTAGLCSAQGAAATPSA